METKFNNEGRVSLPREVIDVGGESFTLTWEPDFHNGGWRWSVDCSDSLIWLVDEINDNLSWDSPNLPDHVRKVISKRENPKWIDYYQLVLDYYFNTDSRDVERQCNQALDCLVPWRNELRNAHHPADLDPYFGCDYVLVDELIALIDASFGYV